MKKTIFFFMLVFMAGLFTVSADPIINDGGRPLGAEGIPMPDWVRSPPNTDDTIFFTGESSNRITGAAKKADARESGLIAFAIWKGITTIEYNHSNYVRETMSENITKTEITEDISIDLLSPVGDTIITYRKRNIDGEEAMTMAAESVENALVADGKINIAEFREVASWIAADGHYIGLYSYPNYKGTK